MVEPKILNPQVNATLNNQKPAKPKPDAKAKEPSAKRHLAENVLLATKMPAKNRLPWILAGAVLGFVAVAGYLYLQSMPSAPDMSMQTPTTMPGSLPPTMPSAAPLEIASAAAKPATTPAETAVSVPEKVVVTPKPVAVVQAAPAQKPAPKPVVSKKPKPATQANLANDSFETDELVVDSPGSIVVKVQQQSPRAESNLQMAYGLLQQQNYVAASRYYQRALHSQPNNVDALLGMAVSAEELGDKATARTYYQKVLALDNANVYAGNGLVRQEQSQFPAEKESSYKALLDKNPDLAETHAELANFYAGQERWHEAQQAYFDAVDKDPENPEYVYNLAISLDHLGKSAVAKRYYEQALQLANTRAVSFDPESIHLRLQQLQGQ